MGFILYNFIILLFYYFIILLFYFIFLYILYILILKKSLCCPGNGVSPGLGVFVPKTIARIENYMLPMLLNLKTINIHKYPPPEQKQIYIAFITYADIYTRFLIDGHVITEKFVSDLLFIKRLILNSLILQKQVF